MKDFEEKFKSIQNGIIEKNNKAYYPYRRGNAIPNMMKIGGAAAIVGVAAVPFAVPIFALMYYGALSKEEVRNLTKNSIPIGEIVSIPDKIFTGNLVSTGKIDEYEKQHLKKYDFHFIRYSINISEKHNDKIDIDTVNIKCKLNDFLSSKERPIVIHWYPKNTFSDKNYSGNITLNISGGLGFEAKKEAKVGEVEADGNFNSKADFQYNYNPKVAKISSFGDGHEINFTFNKIESDEKMPYPTGALEIFAIIMRPRSVEDVALETSVTINNHPIPYKGITRLVLSNSDLNDVKV